MSDEIAGQELRLNLVGEQQLTELIVLSELVQAGVEGADMVRDDFAALLSEHPDDEADIFVLAGLYRHLSTFSPDNRNPNKPRELVYLALSVGFLASAAMSCGEFDSDSFKGIRGLKAAKAVINLASPGGMSWEDQQVLLNLAEEARLAN